jgi:CheY-like chemotaxis protein
VSEVGTSKRVLVVDDHVMGAQALKRALTTLGCTVRVAHDGLSALEIAAEFRPEIVVLDIALPVLNGWEVARRLRSIPLFRRPRLIAVSGLSDPVHRARSLALGFEHHFVKPYVLADLKDALGQPSPN